MVSPAYPQSNETLTGWGSYQDTQYTSGSPFALTANTNTALPNNKGATIEAQKPSDIDTFYDGSVIKGRTGDGLLVTLEYKAIPSSGVNTYIDTWIDIGGSIGQLYRRTSAFTKGATQTSIHISFGAYTLDTWEANGGIIYVRSNTNCSIYDIRYVLTRTHKAT